MSETKKVSPGVKILRFMFRILSILCIDIIVSLLNSRVIELKQYMKPVYVTMVGMTVVVLLFYFLMEYIDRMTTIVLKFTVGLGKTIRYRKTAIFLILVMLYIGIFNLFYRIWFDKWPLLKEFF